MENGIGEFKNAEWEDIEEVPMQKVVDPGFPETFV